MDDAERVIILNAAGRQCSQSKGLPKCDNSHSSDAKFCNCGGQNMLRETQKLYYKLLYHHVFYVFSQFSFLLNITYMIKQ